METAVVRTMVSEDQVREILQGGLWTLIVVNRPEWPAQCHSVSLWERHF
jgi:hypothetical protein